MYSKKMFRFYFQVIKGCRNKKMVIFKFPGMCRDITNSTIVNLQRDILPIKNYIRIVMNPFSQIEIS